MGTLRSSQLVFGRARYRTVIVHTVAVNSPITKKVAHFVDTTYLIVFAKGHQEI